jgi:hypothetical protein
LIITSSSADTVDARAQSVDERVVVETNDSLDSITLTPVVVAEAPAEAGADIRAKHARRRRHHRQRGVLGGHHAAEAAAADLLGILETGSHQLRRDPGVHILCVGSGSLLAIGCLDINGATVA